MVQETKAGVGRGNLDVQALAPASELASWEAFSLASNNLSTAWDMDDDPETMICYRNPDSTSPNLKIACHPRGLGRVQQELG